MAVTDEQKKIIDSAGRRESSLIKISAIAGSGKTHTLLELTKSLNPKSGLYLAYNKTIADESAEKFPEEIECSTIHSMAYRHTVRKFRLNIGFIRARDVPGGKKYASKILILEALEKFFLSKYDRISDFFYSEDYDNLDMSDLEVMKTIFGRMKDGSIPCTHGFYLKLFHILLSRKILNPKKIDLIMIDEFGDINPVMLEIFKLLPANLKVAAGDSQQAIYSFNNTINGFTALKDEGLLFTLSQSFRVSSRIAVKLESFCQSYLDPDMQFKGIDYTDEVTDDSVAYLSRNNSALIGKMIELNAKNIPYNLTRSADVMFRVPMIMLNLKPYTLIKDKEYQFLEDDVIDFHESKELQRENGGSLMKYIQSIHDDDIALKSACSLIYNFKPNVVRDTYYAAKNHAVGEQTHKITLSTSHSAKGTEYSTVHVIDDMNETMDKILEKIEEQYLFQHGKIPTSEEIRVAMTPDEEEFCRLYYVCCSRAKHKLVNAKHLFGGQEIY